MPQTLNVGSRSLFVTVTAWAAIVLAALVSAVAGLQQAEMNSSLPQWQQQLNRTLAGWLLDYLPWVMGATAVLALLMAAAAVGLLLRADWARRVFIVLAALAIAVQAIGLWLQHEVMQALVVRTLGRGGLPAEAADTFGGLAAAAQVLGVLVWLAACALLVWVIRGLMSEPVRQEFV